MSRSKLRRVEARGSSLADRISGLWSREVLEHVCGVGFIRRSFDLRRSKIDVTGLLEFVNLGHCTEPSSAALRGGHCGEIGMAVKEQQRGLDRDESLG
ncbi:hypothetical protein SO802_033959 [Lithocarpus litseifolius]|uniref:Uncharacterized protein n=1 Tax=Lithocarpus litseifolius TaxID=425828 RepID=A0AAW2BHI7_9ROSI